MPTTARIRADCPHCKNEVAVKFNLPDEYAPPAVRCPNLMPSGNMFVYKISSELIKDYLTKKAQKLVAATKLELVPRYIEKKRRHKSDPIRSYAALNIGLSDDVILNNDGGSWFGTIGQDTSRVKIVDSMYESFIKKFRFDPKDVNSWLKDYKTMEELEEAFGINEPYLQELRKYSMPQRVLTTEKKSWVIFSAAPEKIIRDMLADPSTGRVQGKLRIVRTYAISKSVVEYVVHLDPTDLELQEDQHVRQILAGEEKLKN